MAWWFVLLFFSEYGEAWKDSEQLSLLKQHKSKIKKWLSKFGPCSTRLATLPESREDLPHDMLGVLYPDGFTMGHPSIMSLERLRRIVANFRLRDRSKGMDASLPVQAPEASVDGVVQLMTACAGLVKSASSSSAVSQAEPPRLRLFSKSPEPKGSSSLLAIKDKEANVGDVPGDLAPTGTGSEPAPTPAQTISALKTGLSSKEKEESKRMKRPAAAKSSLKRPAAAESSLKRPAAALVPQPSSAVKKKPSSSNVALPRTKKSSKRKASSKSAVADKEARRRLCLSKIPKNVLQSYSSGCSSCRGRPYCTVSCWIKRGYWVET